MIVVIIWTFIVSGIYQGTLLAASLGLSGLEELEGEHVSIQGITWVQLVIFYAAFALVTLVYPLSGFIADIYCGRYRLVSISLMLLFFALLVCCIAIILFICTDIEKIKWIKYIIYALAVIAVLIAVPGLSGFYANTSQLGLDQLLDAPSRTLGVYLHWSIWVELLGETVVHNVAVMEFCFQNKYNNKKHLKHVIRNLAMILPSCFLLLLSIALVVNCFTKRYFRNECARYNPYKEILRVLNYARKNKYPHRRSALHCTGDEIPTRLDFAKQCYGGPFTTSNVEDVKTFMRVVVVLFAISPVFILDVSTSFFLFPIFSMYTVGVPKTIIAFCKPESFFLKSGTLSQLLALAIFPFIMWFVFAVQKNRVPKIFTRLGIGISLLIICLLSMIIPDLIGYSIHKGHSNETMCMFTEFEDSNLNNKFSLNLPWYTLILPNCLTYIGSCLVRATSYEFIAAQTPHTMKGALYGVFFAAHGLFTFLGALFLVPFSLKVWDHFHPVTFAIWCSLGYFTLILCISLGGLVVFVCVARIYKYRQRDNEPYSQHTVEDIFARRLEHESSIPQLIDSPESVTSAPYEDREWPTVRGGCSMRDRSANYQKGREAESLLST